MSKELDERLRVLWSDKAKSRIEELERELEQAKEDHGQACLLVAKMHAAAVGEVTGPKRGVVEDVEDLRLECDALLADNQRLREALSVLPKMVLMTGRNYPQIAAEEALAVTPAQSLARIRNQVREECINAIAVKAVLSEDPIDVQQNCVAAIRATKEPE